MQTCFSEATRSSHRQDHILPHLLNNVQNCKHFDLHKTQEECQFGLGKGKVKSQVHNGVESKSAQNPHCIVSENVGSGPGYNLSNICANMYSDSSRVSFTAALYHFFLILSFFTHLSILALPCNYSAH